MGTSFFDNAGVNDVNLTISLAADDVTCGVVNMGKKACVVEANECNLVLE